MPGDTRQITRLVPEPACWCERGANALVLGLVLLASLLAVSGCTQRWLTIETEPTGARVFLDSIDVGKSPVRLPFEHYGKREVLVRYEEKSENHYAAVARVVELATPWYQRFPLDLLADILWPWRIIDEHQVQITLPLQDINELEQRLNADAASRGIDLGGQQEPPR